MKKYFRHHSWYLFALIVVLLLGVLLVMQLNYDKQAQGVIVVLISFFYVGWGIIHHHTHHDLSVKIVVEYTLIGSLGMSIALFFLKGGIF